MRSKKLKQFLSLGLGLMMAVSPVAGVQAEETHEPVTLRFMWWGGDARHEATIKAIEAFEEKYDWITIEPEYGSNDGYFEKMTTQLSSGNAADVIQLGTGWLPSLVESSPDMFIDFKEYDIELGNFESSFLEQNGNIGGKQYGLPTGIAGYCLIYNKTLADTIGIQMPDSKEASTWDALLELGKKVQEYDSEAYLLNMESIGIFNCVMRPYIVQKTGTPMVVDNKLTFTEEDLAEFLTYLKALYDNKVLVPMEDVAAFTNDNFYTDPKWVSGDTYVAAIIASSTAEPVSAACPDSEFTIGYAPVLADAKDDGYYADCPQYYCVPEDSEHKEEAVLFLDWLLNSEEAAAILTTVRSVPPTKVGQEVCAELGVLEGVAKEAVDLIQANYHGVNQMGISTEDAFRDNVCRDMISMIAYGQGTPEEIAEEYYVLMQDYIDSKE